MRQQSSYQTLKNYFQQLVQQSNFLHDFVGYFSRELHDKQSSFQGVHYPCLALFGYAIDIEGETLQSSALRNMNFGILIGDIQQGDYEQQYQIIDHAENIALKVLARMRYDSNLPEHFLYGALQKNSIEIRPIEIEGSGLFGVEVSFSLKNHQSLRLDPKDWKDIHRICK